MQYIIPQEVNPALPELNPASPEFVPSRYTSQTAYYSDSDFSSSPRSDSSFSGGSSTASSPYSSPRYTGYDSSNMNINPGGSGSPGGNMSVNANYIHSPQQQQQQHFGYGQPQQQQHSPVQKQQYYNQTGNLSPNYIQNANYQHQQHRPQHQFQGRGDTNGQPRFSWPTSAVNSVSTAPHNPSATNTGVPKGISNAYQRQTPTGSFFHYGNIYLDWNL